MGYDLRRALRFGVVFTWLLCHTHQTPSDIEELDRVERRSADQISVATAGMLHKLFIDRCIGILPENARLQYLGVMALDDGRAKQQVHDSGASYANHWNVDATPVAFSFWLSIEPTKQTVCKTVVNKQTLHVNVDFVDGNKGVDAKLPQLGKLSVREVLKMLENEPEKKETRKDAGPNPSKK